jgi:hypothetical protein
MVYLVGLQLVSFDRGQLGIQNAVIGTGTNSALTKHTKGRECLLSSLNSFSKCDDDIGLLELYVCSATAARYNLYKWAFVIIIGIYICLCLEHDSHTEEEQMSDAEIDSTVGGHKENNIVNETVK